MRKIFTAAFVFLLWTASVRSEAVQTGGEASDAPAPSSPLQISVPHSKRTKGNFLDAALDFLFIRFFRTYKGVEITYDFFEINTERDLVFTNFKVKSVHPDAQGTVVAQKVIFDFSDFMKTLKSQKASTSKVEFENVSGDLKIADTVRKNEKNPSEKVFRNAKFKAARVTLKDVALASWGNNPQSDMLAEEASGKNISVALSDPRERYGASSVEVKNIKLPAGKARNVTFSSATVDGKAYMDVFSFLKAVKQ